MKFSICTTWKKNSKLEDIVGIASQLGLEGIEIWDGHIEEYLGRDGNMLEGLQVLLHNHNLKCVAIAPYFNFIEKGKAEESLLCAERCVVYAKGLECNKIRTFLGDKPSAAMSPKEWDTCINGLKKLMAATMESKTFFLLETHNDTPADCKESILRIINEVDNPYLKVLFDGFNFYIDERDMMEEFKALEEYSVHFHVKNYLWKDNCPKPLHKGDVDFTELFRILKAKRYDGFISFEYFCEDIKTLLTDSITWYNSL